MDDHLSDGVDKEEGLAIANAEHYDSYIGESNEELNRTGGCEGHDVSRLRDNIRV